jgi:hypothetical protein
MNMLLHWENPYEINVMWQITELIKFMVFDIMVIILTINDFILIFYLSTVIRFIYSIK